MKSLIPFITLFICCISCLYAQNTVTKVEMIPSLWEFPSEAVFEKFDNRNTLLLNGKATVKNLEFTNGTIEVDVYAKSERSFAGIIFRKQKHTMEEVYMRLHKSNQVDAIQYSPTFNKELTWQLYKEYQAKIAFKKKGWNTLRVAIKNNIAKVFINNKEVLVVDHLRTGFKIGEIGLFALFTNRFSNFRYTVNNIPDEKIKTEPYTETSNIISKWHITKAVTYVKEKFQFGSFSDMEQIEALTEKSGLLPISKYIEKPSSGSFEQNKEAFTVATTIIDAEKDMTKIFSFDYSDKIMVYLNGQLLFKGNNAFRSKGIQHTGHIDINANQLHLQLKQGSNKLQCVVIDKANGWGLIAKLK